MNKFKIQSLVFLLFVTVFSSCKNEKTITKTKPVVEKAIKVENKIKEVDFYLKTDSLLEKQFGKRIKFIDFKENSTKKPHHFDFFNKLGLINVRSYVDPTFNKSYISKQFENYTLFIFEYKNSTFSEKAFLQLCKDNERIIEMIKKDEISLSSNKTFKKGTRDERAKMISKGCKGGGMIFQKGKYIFNIVKTCRLPLTIKKIKWKEYENIFLSLYLNKTKHKTLVLNAGCGDLNYRKEYYSGTE